MPSIGLTSIAGAPGVTTLALALSYTASTSTLIVEADTSRSSAILSGYFQGTIAPDRGILEVAMKASTHRLEAKDLWEEVLQIDTDGRQYLMPGIYDPTAANGIDHTVWSVLGDWTRSMSGGVTPIIDFGRLTPQDRRQGLLTSVSHLAIVCQATLPNVLALQGALKYLDELLPADMVDSRLGLILVDQPGIGNYTDREIAHRIGLPVWGRLKHDLKTAMAFSHHTRDLPESRADRRKAIRKSPLLRSAQSLHTSFKARDERTAQIITPEGADAL